MVGFVVRRTARMAVTVLAVVLVTFGLTKLAYQNPARMLAPDNASQETVDAIANSLRLNDPWWVQLWHYVVHGPEIKGTPTGLLNWPPSLGYSYRMQRPVTELIAEKIPVTASLAIGALVIWIVLSVLAGVYAARRPGGWFDTISSGASYVMLSVPTFVTGVVLLYVLFYQLSLHGLKFFPSGGYVPLTENPAEWARHLLLPWLTLVLAEVGLFQRVVRASVLEVAGADYIRTARAKGLPPWRVYFDHALSAAANPILTLGAIEFAAILGGAIITEQIFGLDGVGRLAVNAAQSGDAPVVIGCTLFGAVVFVLSTFVIDVITHARSGK
ncbi:binding--dependent transport system inner membrane component family protein [Mycolicibacterium hassiacum DSM 44199]|uniref:Binding--dependent transport system inner membrane component family protein n=1 Tax=Mycolicibacterium hassiacum (strain DSM 44199 / CIP 105218 / JCM 12690 / 3849) TaxID=1122247 RepID=K5BJI2_MYCHD|nr:ABC transporter permease [Mycolicibacterium hassiacum]EKF23159.1 binding--dependent transport system inner membrane component family protein [Mycolicibacterium hassiacum DSM 44199]MDA4085588.1 peptide ABC transporter permease [Mycolicibacterium hassiacum DSM 44199]VCT89628.1 Glutathione transport system permease protein GsiC [Mycolicibacterium hassiacum DSM 44199]